MNGFSANLRNSYIMNKTRVDYILEMIRNILRIFIISIDSPVIS